MRDRNYALATLPFEAARQVDILPEGYRSRRLHGHSFWALDYARLNDLIAVPTDD